MELCTACTVTGNGFNTDSPIAGAPACFSNGLDPRAGWDCTCFLQAILAIVAHKALAKGEECRYHFIEACIQSGERP